MVLGLWRATGWNFYWDNQRGADSVPLRERTKRAFPFDIIVIHWPMRDRAPALFGYRNTFESIDSIDFMGTSCVGRSHSCAYAPPAQMDRDF